MKPEQYQQALDAYVNTIDELWVLKYNEAILSALTILAQPRDEMVERVAKAIAGIYYDDHGFTAEENEPREDYIRQAYIAFDNDAKAAIAAALGETL